jgi:HK97 gp10 family phage protein
MAGFKLKLEGNKALLKNLDKLNKGTKTIIGQEIDESVRRIERDADARAPKDTSFLRNSIRGEFDKNTLKGQVEAGMEYAAFVEFGTGSKVKVPAGLESYANEFRGRKLSSQGKASFKKNLEAWMKRKGIDEKYLFPIMMKILRVGVEPKPFLFPAFHAEAPKLVERIKRAIKKWN